MLQISLKYSFPAVHNKGKMQREIIKIRGVKTQLIALFLDLTGFTGPVRGIPDEINQKC